MTRSNKVLVISAGPEQFSLAVSRLQFAGCSVLYSQDSIEGLATAKDELPGLIISELAMPNIDGLELCRRVRLDDELSATPILLVGDLSETSSIVKDGLRCGASDYVVKRIDQGDLFKRCSSLIGLKSSDGPFDDTEDVFRTLIENVSDIIAIISADGTILFESPSVERSLGFKPEELIGKQGFDMVHPGDVDRVMEYFKTALHSFSAAPPIEYRCRHKDGSWKFLESIGKPYNDAQNGLVVVITSRDTTERKSALDAKRETDERLSAIFDSAAIGMALVNPSGHSVQSNPALQKMLGYTAEELCQMSFVEFTHPDDIDADVSLYKEITDGKREYYQIEKRYITKQGSIVWVRLTISVVDPDSNDTRYVIAMVEDINDQKTAQAALLESEERFRAQFQGLPVPTFTWRKVGDDFIFQGYNVAADTLTRGGLEKLVGLEASKHFADQPAILESFHRCVNERTSVNQSGPYRFQSSGELKYLDANIVFIKPDIVMVACRDITEQTETERLLKESRERFELVSVATNDGLWDWNFATNKLWLNEEFYNLLGVRPGDVDSIKEIWYAAIHPDDRKRVMTSVRSAIDTGVKYWAEEYRMTSTDGRELTILDRSYVIYDADGKPMRMIGAVMDISDLRRTETALLKSQQHFTLAQQAARIGSFELDLKTHETISSPELENLYGTEPGALNRSYEEWLRHIHEEDLAHVTREMARSAYTGEHESEFRIARPDGDVRWMYSKGKVFYEADGAASRLVGVNMDITERKLAEQDLQAGRIRLFRQNKVLNELNMHHKLFGESPEDAIREILEVSARTIDVEHVSVWLYADNKSRLKSVDLYERSNDRHQTASLELSEVDYPVFFRALGEDAAVIVADVAHDPRTVELVSSFPPAERITSALSVPIRLAGEVVGMICYAHICGPHDWMLDEQNFGASMADMISLLLEADKRKQTEAALAEANERAISEYVRLTERLADLAQHLGTARNIKSVFDGITEFAINSVPCSALLIFLYDKEKQTRKAVHIWYSGSEIDVGELQAVPVGTGPAGRAIVEGEVIVIDDYVKRISQRSTNIQMGYDEDPRHPQSAMMIPMKVMGRVIGVVEVQAYEKAAFTNEDAIAMRMAANLAANAIENVRLLEAEQAQAEQLRQAQRLESVGRLAGGIAHDFNNMLTAIKGYSDLTLRRLPEGDPLRGNVEEIKKAGERSAELTQQLLAFSRRQVMRPKVIDLNNIVSETSTMLDRLIGEDIELGLALADDLGSVQADPGQISQVIINLAVNSRDAMPEGGKITIETANKEIDGPSAGHDIDMKPGRYVMLAISDTGIGMDDEVQKHIFEPFFTTKPTGKGTGLGLATVYGIVKQSGGYIWAYSEVGHGTAVKVYLPRIDAEVDEIVPGVTFAADLKGNETILLVEDEDLVRRMSKQILETCGYKVIEATDGTEALAMCMRPEHEFDLLVTDVVMPKMSGRQLVQNLETVRPDLRVLFMSGYTDDSIVRHGVIESGENFIQKPFTFNALAGKVREMLDLSKN
jgi:PAS domain S-box-containing protein